MNNDIKHFSIDELLELFNLEKGASRSEIIDTYNSKIKNYKNKKSLNILENAKNKLLKHLDDNNINVVFGDRQELFDNSMIIQKEKINLDSTHIFNPLKRRIQKKTITIHTKHRDLYVITKCKNRKLDNTIVPKNYDLGLRRMDNTAESADTGYNPGESIQHSTSDGLGTGATFMVTVNNNGTVTEITYNGGGSNYSIGEVITLSGGDNNSSFIVDTIDEQYELNPDIYNYDKLKQKVNNLTPDENNELIVSHDVNAITENELYVNFSTSNTSTLHTIPSFDINNCQREDLENKNSTYTDVFDDNGKPLKKYCGNSNKNFIKNKRLENSIVFEEHTQIDDTKRQYKENASNFLYDFNFKFNNIIKTTLLTICINKKIINLFAPGKNYYMTVRLSKFDGIKVFSVDVDISVCTSIGKDSLEDVLKQINTQLKKIKQIETDWFTNIDNKEKTFTLKLPLFNNITEAKFLNKKTCNYVDSLAFKLNLLHTTATRNVALEKEIRFPEFLYFLYDDLTNNYHTSYYASTRESSLPSTVLASIPLQGDEYKLDNSGTDLDAYSREYFGKINIEKARFELLSPDGDLVNIDQTDFIENNYHMQLLAECVYEI